MTDKMNSEKEKAKRRDKFVWSDGDTKIIKTGKKPKKAA